MSRRISLIKTERKVTLASSLLYTGTRFFWLSYISFTYLPFTLIHVCGSEKDQRISGCSGQVKAQTDFFSPSGHICVCFRSKHIPKIWKKCQSARQINWLENAENKTIIHEMESAKLTKDDPLMPSMYPEEVYSLHPLAKPAPLSEPRERRRAKLPASLPSPPLPWLFHADNVQGLCFWRDSALWMRTAFTQLCRGWACFSFCYVEL